MTHGIKKIFEATRKVVPLFHENQIRKQNGILLGRIIINNFFFKALKVDVLKITYKNE